MLNPRSIILPWRPISVKWWSGWHHRIKQRQQQQACTRSTSLGVKWMDRAQGVWGLHASSCFSGRAVLIPFLLTSVGRDHWSSSSVAAGPRVPSDRWTPQRCTGMACSMQMAAPVKHYSSPAVFHWAITTNMPLPSTALWWGSQSVAPAASPRSFQTILHYSPCTSLVLNGDFLQKVWFSRTRNSWETSWVGWEAPSVTTLQRKKAELWGDCLDSLLSEPRPIVRICQI